MLLQQARRSDQGLPQRRVRGKTPPPRKVPQERLPEPLALEDEAPADCKRTAYLR